MLRMDHDCAISPIALALPSSLMKQPPGVQPAPEVMASAGHDASGPNRLRANVSCNQLVGCTSPPMEGMLCNPTSILGLVRTAEVNSNIKRALPASRRGQKSTFSRAKAATIFIRLRAVIDITTSFDTGLLMSGTRHK